MKTSITDQTILRLMGKPSISRIDGRCCICGKVGRTETHHIVKRSAGKAFDARNHELRKPTIDLCGFGNNLRDADGNYYCHGLAEHNMLHFDWVDVPFESWGRKLTDMPTDLGHWEYLFTDEPTKRLSALSKDGWKRVGSFISEMEA